MIDQSNITALVLVTTVVVSQLRVYYIMILLEFRNLKLMETTSSSSSSSAYICFSKSKFLLLIVQPTLVTLSSKVPSVHQALPYGQKTTASLKAGDPVRQY